MSLKHETDPGKLKKQFSQRLSAEREARHMTQEELAYVSGVSESSIKKFENEKSLPALDTLMKLCNEFHCDVEYLTGASTEPLTIQKDIEVYTGISEAASIKLHHNKDVYQKMMSHSVDNDFDYQSDELPEWFLNSFPGVLSAIIGHPAFNDLIRRITNEIHYSFYLDEVRKEPNYKSVKRLYERAVAKDPTYDPALPEPLYEENDKRTEYSFPIQFRDGLRELMRKDAEKTNRTIEEVDSDSTVSYDEAFWDDALTFEAETEFRLWAISRTFMRIVDDLCETNRDRRFDYAEK